MLWKDKVAKPKAFFIIVTQKAETCRIIFSMSLKNMIANL